MQPYQLAQLAISLPFVVNSGLLSASKFFLELEVVWSAKIHAVATWLELLLFTELPKCFPC